MKDSKGIGSKNTWDPRLVASWVTLSTALILFSIKGAAYLITHSQVILADALETVVNIVAGVIGLLVIKTIITPKDESHPYGHGKFEYFSSIVEGVLIAIAGIAIVSSSATALISGEVALQEPIGMAMVLGAATISFSLGFYLKKVGDRHQSDALLASSAHLFSDVWTSLASVGGYALYLLTEIYWLDSFFGILVALYLIWTGYKVIRHGIAVLTDEVEPEAIHEFAVAAEKSMRPGLIDIHQLKMIRSGSFHHIDAHLVVPEFWNVQLAHDMSVNFEREITKNYPFQAEVAFHLDPCEKKYCQWCELEVCPIRQERFVQRRPFGFTNLVSGPEQ